jgi:hypothetical protein
MAGIRGRAAGLVETSGFIDRVQKLLKTAPAVHADETPQRAGADDRGRAAAGHGEDHQQPG